MKLIFDFVFAYAKSRFSHDAAHCKRKEPSELLISGEDSYKHLCLFSNPVELVYCMLCCYYLVID